MTPAARDWLDGLRRFSEEHRAPRPARRVPVPSETTPAFDAERAILSSILDGACRATIHLALADRPDAAVVLTTTPAGFGAAGDLAASLDAADAARFVAVTEPAYRGWCMRSPDESFRLHDNVWSWVKAPVPASRRTEFAAWPIPSGEHYWIHRRGRRGPLGESRSADLWAWNGSRATLLATGIVERAGRPG